MFGIQSVNKNWFSFLNKASQCVNPKYILITGVALVGIYAVSRLFEFSSSREQPQQSAEPKEGTPSNQVSKRPAPLLESEPPNVTPLSSAAPPCKRRRPPPIVTPNAALPILSLDPIENAFVTFVNRNSIELNLLGEQLTRPLFRFDESEFTFPSPILFSPKPTQILLVNDLSQFQRPFSGCRVLLRQRNPNNKKIFIEFKPAMSSDQPSFILISKLIGTIQHTQINIEESRSYAQELVQDYCRRILDLAHKKGEKSISMPANFARFKIDIMEKQTLVKLGWGPAAIQTLLRDHPNSYLDPIPQLFIRDWIVGAAKKYVADHPDHFHEIVLIDKSNLHNQSKQLIERGLDFLFNKLAPPYRRPARSGLN